MENCIQPPVINAAKTYNRPYSLEAYACVVYARPTSLPSCGERHAIAWYLFRIRRPQILRMGRDLVSAHDCFSAGIQAAAWCVCGVAPSADISKNWANRQLASPYGGRQTAPRHPGGNWTAPGHVSSLFIWIEIGGLRLHQLPLSLPLLSQDGRLLRWSCASRTASLATLRNKQIREEEE